MTSLQTFSNELAQLVDAAAPTVVQVIGARRPASGIVHGPSGILTTARALGREDGLQVRAGGDTVEADLAGWDPATGLALLRTRKDIGVQPPRTAPEDVRPGELLVALARSWSNAVTASAGVVAVVGGPLRTGRGRQIPRVFRVTAPVHEGFAGAGVFDMSGRLAGIATASAIRGFAVGIPTTIAWATAAQLLASGTPRRGFIGVAVQPVDLPQAQQRGGRKRALLVVTLTPSGPAESAGLLVGDLLFDFDGVATESPDDLLDRLTGTKIGHEAVAHIARGGVERDIRIVVAERPRG